MTDRELLDLAAKAAGIECIRWNTMLACYETMEGAWNPLTDDGCALRLANKLRINLQYGFEGECAVNAYKHDGSCDVEEMGEDQDAATRRAIVRAAAKIGRAMP